ncbi:phage tail protein [Streptomyces sp. NPDC049577]|uniref:phage tail protein n=1 Tax=Streptomyces sp. NPDC049577 TaxID=3155153 RepID=UPI0034358BB6
MADEEVLLTPRFRVTVGPRNLGAFASCDGLGCEIELEEYREGGMNDRVWWLPTRLRYPNIVLTRPVTRDTAKVWQWLRPQVERVCRTGAEIQALRTDGKPLIHWTLADVLPVRWSGPSFTVDDVRGTVERLELCHHGIIDVRTGR